MLEHEIHHRGQLYMMLGLYGIKPTHLWVNLGGGS